MSKLALAITTRDTGKLRALKSELSTVDLTESFTPLMLNGVVCQEYAIEARLGAKVYLTELEQVQSSTALQGAVTATRKQVIEEVFGEFRPLIAQLRVALYDTDTHRARDILFRLERQMFSEGV